MKDDETPFPVDFPPGTSPEDKSDLLRTPMVRRWIDAMAERFSVSRVTIVSVDWTFRRPRRALFVKLRADARDRVGRPLNGIVLLRGDAVGILVVLRVEGEAEPRLLLVRQARVPAAEPVVCAQTVRLFGPVTWKPCAAVSSAPSQRSRVTSPSTSMRPSTVRSASTS